MKFRALLIAMIILGSFISGAVYQAYAGQESDTLAGPNSSSIYEEVVYVNSGDTLWSIANSVASDGEDVRDLVYEIKKINKLKSSVLQVGQALVIPNQT